MKELGYGSGYRYGHDYEEGYAEQDYLPEKLKGREFYSPKGYGYERTIIERMNILKGKSGTGKENE
jgi:putative ATPase